MYLEPKRTVWVVRCEEFTRPHQEDDWKFKSRESEFINEEVAIHKAKEIATKFSTEKIRDDFDKMADYKEETVYVLRRVISDEVTFELP